MNKFGQWFRAKYISLIVLLATFLSKATYMLLNKLYMLEISSVDYIKEIDATPKLKYNESEVLSNMLGRSRINSFDRSNEYNCSLSGLGHPINKLRHDLSAKRKELGLLDSEMTKATLKDLKDWEAENKGNK